MGATSRSARGQRACCVGPGGVVGDALGALRAGARGEGTASSVSAPALVDGAVGAHGHVARATVLVMLASDAAKAAPPGRSQQPWSAPSSLSVRVQQPHAQAPTHTHDADSLGAGAGTTSHVRCGASTAWASSTRASRRWMGPRCTVVELYRPAQHMARGHVGWPASPFLVLSQIPVCNTFAANRQFGRNLLTLVSYFPDWAARMTISLSDSPRPCCPPASQRVE